jgi:two-component system sensor histidine kinase YesM
MLKYKRSLQRLGIAGVSIPIRQLREHLLLPKQLNDQRLLLLMVDGTILADTQALEEGKRLNPLYLGSEHGEGSSYWVQPSRDERLFVTRTRLQQPGWTIMSLVPERTLMGSMNIVRNALIGLLVLYLGLGGWIGFYLFTKLTRPITDLAAWMKQVDTGNLEVRSIPYNGQGEIPFLFRSFQMMVVRLKEQIEQIYASEREKKELEFEALNFQIRPHFLYNTLDAIKWKAKRGQEDEVVQMIESLSVVLRRTLTDMSFVTLRQEVDLVKHYVELEQHRHKNAFSILYDIDEQLLDQEVPRLLIQPLVENAIRHGALKSDEHGLILMRIYRRRSVVVEVQDNGPGFPEQFRPQRELPREHNELGGIGLANVHKRLELYYGTDSHMEWGKTEHGYTFIRLLLD